MQITEAQLKAFVDTFASKAEGIETELGRTGLATATKDLQKAIESPIGLSLVTLGVNTLLSRVPTEITSVLSLLLGAEAVVAKAA